MRRYPSVKELDRFKKPGRYLAGPNLFLQISQWHTKSWIFRYRFNGRPRHMGLGAHDLLSLSEARDKAHELRRQLKIQKLDPLEARRADAQATRRAFLRDITFKGAAQRYIDERADVWRGNASRDQWLQSLHKYAFALIGDISVASIGKAEVVAVLDAAKAAPETRQRLKHRLARILDFAHAQGWRETSENPAANRHLLAPRKNGKHFTGMHYEDVPAFMARLRETEGLWARGLELHVLCASRPIELYRARWGEFDLERANWTRPPEHMKNHKEHRIPLSPRAVEIMRALPHYSDFAFPGRSGGQASDSRLRRQLRRMGIDVDVHGFRAAFKTWAGEQTAYPRELIEVALAHSLGSLDEAYRRADMMQRRRQLMEAWSEYCSKPDTANGVVVPLRQGA
jgi:integrase